MIEKDPDWGISHLEGLRIEMNEFRSKDSMGNDDLQMNNYLMNMMCS